MQSTEEIRKSKVAQAFSEKKVDKQHSIADDYLRQMKTERHWKTVATICLLSFSLLLFGFFVYEYLPLGTTLSTVKYWYTKLDSNIHWVFIAGFLAQIVDGSLGMGYGVTSSAILLSTGLSPATISGSVHTSEVFASAASGYSHYKFGNVNKKLFKALKSTEGGFVLLLHYIHYFLGLSLY